MRALHNKRLLFLLPNLERGGTQLKILSIVQHLMSKHLEMVSVVTIGSPLDLFQDFFKVTDVCDLGRRRSIDKYSFSALVRLRKEINSRKPTTIVCTDPFVLIYLWPLIRGRKRKTLRTVLLLNTAFYSRWRDRVWVYIYKQLTVIVDVAIFGSNWQMKKWATRFKLERRSLVIYNGVDYKDKFLPPFTSSSTRIGDCIKIGSLGRLVVEKNHISLVRLSKSLTENCILHTIEVAGSGPLRSTLVSAVSDAGQEKNFFLQGETTEPNIFLQKLDIFILPSIRENFSNAVIQAMACGLPVIVSNVGGASELVIDEITGFLYQPTDEDQLFSICLRLINDLQLRTTIGAAARDFVKKHFDADVMLGKYESVLLQ